MPDADLEAVCPRLKYLPKWSDAEPDNDWAGARLTNDIFMTIAIDRGDRFEALTKLGLAGHGWTLAQAQSAAIANVRKRAEKGVRIVSQGGIPVVLNFEQAANLALLPEFFDRLAIPTDRLCFGIPAQDHFVAIDLAETKGDARLGPLFHNKVTRDFNEASEGDKVSPRIFVATPPGKRFSIIPAMPTGGAIETIMIT